MYSVQRDKVCYELYMNICLFPTHTKNTVNSDLTLDVGQEVYLAGKCYGINMAKDSARIIPSRDSVPVRHRFPFARMPWRYFTA